VIRQILIALGIGCLLTVWFMQKDDRVKNYIGTQFITTFQKAVGCTFDGNVESIDFFSPSLTFANVRVYNADKPGWSWSAKRFTASCSWWYLMMYRAADLRVHLDNLEAHTAIVDGKPMIADHMQNVFMGLKFTLPIELKSVTFKQAACHIHDAQQQMKAHIAWQCELKKMQGRLKVSGYLLDGALHMRDRVMFETLKGALQADIGQPDESDLALNIDCSVELPYFPPTMRQTFVAGSWKGTSGTFSLKNVHEQLVIDPIQLFYDGTRGRCSIRGAVPLASLWRFAHNNSSKNEVAGLCSLHCDMRYEDNACAVSGRVALDDCAYKDHALGAAVITYAREDGQWSGNIHAKQEAVYGLQGAFNWQEATNCGSFSITNPDPVQLPSIMRMAIKPEQLRGDLKIENGKISGSYAAAINSLWNNIDMQCAGSITSDGTQVMSEGSFHNNKYQCAVQLKPSLQLVSCSYDDQSGTPLIRLSGDMVDESVIHALVGLPFLRSVAETFGAWPMMQAEGSIAASIKQQPHGAEITLTTMDALMRVPQTYNVMRDAKGKIQINTQERTIVAKDIACQFHEGRLLINRATMQYDQDNGVRFMHVPIVAENLMINMEQGLLAKVSGYGLLSKRPDAPTDIAGNVIIDRAYLKENLLSGTFHKNLFKYTGSPFASYSADTTCDIQISSRVPVRVKTPFLETAVRVNVHVGNTFKDPVVTGSVNLLSGHLAFPYRPLYISKGTIYFLPHQLHDPSIELIAKNKIKKYDVELQVTGSLQNHQIALDASPSLTEEQAVALLLVGSEEESLNVVMPALIMQNLQTIVFGYDQSARAVDKVFASLLQPFNHIHVLPSFSDKTGRGGLRGAIEIDVNDRWRALIQKNFNLTEDMRIEVEYLVSDDISVRAVANERRDVGAEVEMKWKF
jgi:hypothetical protein